MASHAPPVYDGISSSSSIDVETTQDGKVLPKEHVMHEYSEKMDEKILETQEGVAPLDDIDCVRDKIETLTIDECRLHIERM